MVKFIATLSVSLLISCSSSKLTSEAYPPYEKSNLIEDIYVQREIPGTQEDSIHTYLFLKVKRTESEQFKFQKLIFNQEEFILNPSKFNYKLEIDNYKNNNGGNFGPATIYFTINDSAFSQKTNRVPSKEDLYLP